MHFGAPISYNIHQVMAIATLALCYNNTNVFTGVVKIRKGLAVRMILDSTNMDNIMMVFDEHLADVLSKIPKDDPNAKETEIVARNGMQVRFDGCPVL